MARAPHIYRVERRCVVLPRRAFEALGVTHHSAQGDVLVVAANATQAAAILAAIGMGAPRSAIGRATGNDVEMLTAAGQLQHPGTVLAYRNMSADNMVLALTDGTAEPIGVWRYVERIGGARAGKTIVFERIDGRRFELQPA